ncbi:MAG TPA: hypothetical protein VGF67_05480 [Ktedonobacteraceae bacterium]
MGQVVRVSGWSVICVRIDTTTARSSADVNEQGLWKLVTAKTSAQICLN